MWDWNDDQLLAETARGNQQAFNRLVQRHSPKLHAILYRYLGTGEDADEVVQEVFWQVWQSSAKWQPGRARFSTWLYRVAVNRAIDRLRKMKRRPELAVHALPETGSNLPDSETQLADRQALSAMQKAIAGLPDKQRLAIVLSTHEQHSNAEIARIMDTTEGAVEQLLIRARRKLREIYRGLT